jgi:anthranilate synthase component 1
LIPEPNFEAFARRYDKGERQVVWTTLVADLTTPVAALLKLGRGKPYTFLFESIGFAEGAPVRGRYSILGLKPDIVWRFRGERAEINRKALTDLRAFEPCTEPTLASLRSLIAQSRITLPTELPPMAAGIFGYLGYDTVRLFERLPDLKPDLLKLPDGVLLRPSVVIVFDIVRDVMTLVTSVGPEPRLAAREAYARASERLGEVIQGLAEALPEAAPEPPMPTTRPAPQSNTTAAEYLAMVERAKEYIRAGDIYQVVPSQRFRIPFTLPPVSLYRALRRTNPSPYMYFLDFDGFALVGSSPETLVSLRGDTVTIRPIAGTYARGATPEEDRALQARLLQDPKERAEHLMLLDLGRNDVGRVAKLGTVRVTDAFALQLLSQVMHIVSNVEGTLDPHHDAVSVLAAGFPAGTVSGAPKIRAMEIIEELEKERRGPYAGAVGYFSAGGSMDSCIVLRTAILKDGMMYVQAGGGVVADSVPEREYQETVDKAKAVFRAAEEAVRYAGTSNSPASPFESAADAASSR